MSSSARHMLIVVNQGNAKWQLHSNNMSTQVSSDTYGGILTVQSSDWNHDQSFRNQEAHIYYIVKGPIMCKGKPLAGNPLTLIFPILSRYIYTTILLSVRHSVKTHTILYRQVPTRHILYTIISLLIYILHISINYTNKHHYLVTYFILFQLLIWYYTLQQYYTIRNTPGFSSPAVKLLIRCYTLQQYYTTREHTQLSLLAVQYFILRTIVINVNIIHY